MTLREARKCLKNNLKYLRKAGKEVRLSINYKVVMQILRENLQLFEREGLSALKQLKPIRKLPGYRNHTPIITVCEDTVLNMNRNIGNALTEQLQSQNRWLTTYELSAIPDILKIHLINLAVIGVKNENADILESAVLGLHQLKDVDMEKIFTRFSYTEKTFLKDPAGIYSHMDTPTKAHYRHQCARIAAQNKTDENEMADSVLKEATEQNGHIGFSLFEKSKDKQRNRMLGYSYIVCQYTLPLLLSGVLTFMLSAMWLFPLLYVPIHAIVRRPLARLFTLKVPPYFMPRMELKQSIPKEHQTLVTVSALLPREKDAKSMAEHLEQLYLANNNGAIDFCLLADFPESKEEHLPEDSKKADSMKAEIRRLNQKYNNRFLLVIRNRTFSKTQDAYAGWERKRGAILQLVHAIRGETNDFYTLVDPGNKLKTVRYILALDQDSQLFFNAAYDMVTVAAHPLNRPQIDSERRIVTKGYGVLVPIIANRIDSVSASAFSKLYSGRGGISAYHSLSSNLYQDLMETTVFSGKGLLHVDACYTCLSDSIEEERVLSHDIVEGSFLRCGLISDVEIADSNPASAIAWNKRQHRWIRGDFQNLIWLFPNIGRGNNRRRNPLPGLNRLMITDNLIRALYPVFSLFLLWIAATVPRLAHVCIIIGLANILLPGLASCIVSFAKNGLSSLNQQYYSPLIPLATNDFLRCIVSCIFLVTDAAVALGAAAKGLYRQFISHRRCMEWATANEAEFNNKNGLLAHLYHNVLSVTVGIVFLLFAPSYTAGFGLLFALSPLLQWWMSKPIKQTDTPSLSTEDTAFLLAEGKKMWRYYADTCQENDNFLPPDNLQEQPVYAVAHRTSPTNIGLMLLSTVCAENLGYISCEEMMEKIDKTYASVEKLIRWRGHLLNWYDTKTLAPLFPRYCSTVDSGNFACCLTAVKNRLKSINNETASDLVSRMEKDLNGMDFKTLYNSHRHLFHIGFDLESQTLSDSYYDMLMSECRMTSYYAIAKRQIPKKHWSTLGRTLTHSGRHVGPMSWTGTAFEYLMPPILLPVYENTLSFEAIRFCIACQKHAAPDGKPWGNSESGYYEFDESLFYQYKPHGVPSLALKCMDRSEYVVSPYSTFLSLPFVPKSALKNLRIIQKLGAFGKYGYYEAIDFTNKRCSHCDHEIVRSYMAHHVGMSLCSLENTLNPHFLQNLFMQDEMAGAESLLMEIIPGGASVYNHLSEKDVPDKPRFPAKQPFTAEIPAPTAPTYVLLANKQRRLQIAGTGEITSLWKDLNLYSTSFDFLETAPGMMFFLDNESGQHSLTLSPHYENGDRYRFVTSKNSVTFSYKEKDLTATVKLSLAHHSGAEVRTITLKNRSQQEKTCRLVLYFEPLLHTKEQIRSHPAFCKLFLESEYEESTNRLFFTKKVRGENTPACLSIGFAEKDIAYTFCCNTREAVKFEGNRFCFPAHSSSKRQSIPDPCCCISVPVTLPPKGVFEKNLIIAVGESRQAASENFDKGIADRKSDNPFFDKTVEGRLAHKLLPYIIQPNHSHNHRLRCDQYRLTDLWQVGISGEYPIIVSEIRASADLVRIKPYLDAYARLKQYDIICDFVILYKELGDYSRKQYADISTAVNNCGLSKRIGKSGGIHLINTAVSSIVRKAILASAAYVITRSLPENKDSTTIFKPIHLLRSQPSEPNLTKTHAVAGGYFSNDCFVITSEPKVPWSHLLANSEFGIQLTQKSLGFSYAHNARENRLTPWSNDPVTHHTGERLLLKLNGRYYDLIEGSTPVFSPGYARYHGRILHHSYTVTVTVRNMQKHLCIQFTKPLPKDCLLAYYTAPALAFDRKNAHQLIGTVSNGIPAVHQPFNAAYSGWMAMHSNLEMKICFDGIAFWSGRWENTFQPPFDKCCMAGIVSIADKAVFTLSYGSTEEDARKHAQQNPTEKILSNNGWKIKTENKALDVMVNHFLPHQVLTARLFARTGFFQCSGAFGFRDQLQDAGNMVFVYPELTKKQLLLCCARQFEEGDVLHWWHELPSGPAGVRTRCSDDLLWLPLYTARYVAATGDIEILNRTVPFLTAPLLAEHQQERYDTSFGHTTAQSVYIHCKKAIDKVGLSNRGLALIGSCDWNDGFSAVGHEGKGESVWLTQFYAMVCESFASVAHQMQESNYANLLIKKAELLKKAVATHCWDTDRYTRAYFDNGSVIGASACKENQLDALSQAFSVLADIPNHERNKQAVFTAYNTLVDHENQLIRLFSPAFESINAGYISSYPVGIRENGGQYTHGVIWLIQALLRINEAEKAFELISYINPASHCETQKIAARYEGEPYAVAGDVYTHPEVPGKSGWTHYTGAAGWLYRIIWEDLFGIRLQGNTITVQPCLPKALYNASCSVQVRNTTVNIDFRITRSSQAKVVIPLDGQVHHVTIDDKTE